MSSQINLAARRLLDIAVSFEPEPLDKKIEDLSLKDVYKEPNLCIRYSNAITLISEQYKINLQLSERLGFLLSKSEEKSGKQKTYTESYSITSKFITFSNDTVFASQVECVKLSATESKKPYRISEIKTLPAEKEGGGQTGAEIFLNLVNKPEEDIPSYCVWVSRRSNYFPLDDSCFTNEFFMPAYSSYFQQLSADTRKRILQEQKLLNNGISSDTIKDIYQAIYDNNFLKKDPITLILKPGRELTKISSLKNGWQYIVANILCLF